MEAWQREAIALVVAFLFLLVGQVTVQDVDCLYEVREPEEIIPFSDEELDAALATGSVTADQCVFMESQGIAWQIDVRHQ